MHSAANVRGCLGAMGRTGVDGINKSSVYEGRGALTSAQKMRPYSGSLAIP